MKELLPAAEVDEVLRRAFYQPGAAARPRTKGRRGGSKAARPAKADHYEVICISLYKDDLARLDRKVAQLKKAGHRKMNRSALIRFALDTADLGRLPRSY